MALIQNKKDCIITLQEHLNNKTTFVVSMQTRPAQLDLCTSLGMCLSLNEQQATFLICSHEAVSKVWAPI